MDQRLDEFAQPRLQMNGEVAIDDGRRECGSAEKGVRFFSEDAPGFLAHEDGAQQFANVAGAGAQLPDDAIVIQEHRWKLEVRCVRRTGCCRTGCRATSAVTVCVVIVVVVRRARRSECDETCGEFLSSVGETSFVCTVAEEGRVGDSLQKSQIEGRRVWS